MCRFIPVSPSRKGIPPYAMILYAFPRVESMPESTFSIQVSTFLPHFEKCARPICRLFPLTETYRVSRRKRKLFSVPALSSPESFYAVSETRSPHCFLRWSLLNKKTTCLVQHLAMNMNYYCGCFSCLSGTSCMERVEVWRNGEKSEMARATRYESRGYPVSRLQRAFSPSDRESSRCTSGRTGSLRLFFGSESELGIGKTERERDGRRGRKRPMQIYVCMYS